MPITTNKHAFHFWNMLIMPGAVLTGTGIESSNPLANLQDPRLSRRIKFTTAAGEKAVIIDCSGIASTFRKAENLAIAGHNLSNIHTITVYAHTSNSWGAPNKTVSGLTIPVDPDTDPATWGETNVTKQVYRTLFFDFGEDILSGGNTWLKIVISTPAGYDPVEIGALHIGWSKQYEINFGSGWHRGVRDMTAVLRSSAHIPFANAKDVRDTRSLVFDPSILNDTHIAKYFINNFGIWKPLFISTEPDATTEAYDKDGYRVHSHTLYGRGQIRAIRERATRIFAYELLFQEEFGASGVFNVAGSEGSGLPPAPVEELDDFPLADLFTFFTIGSSQGQAITTGATGEKLTLFDTVWDPLGWSDGAVGAGVNTASQMTINITMNDAVISGSVTLQISGAEYEAELLIEVNGTEVARASRSIPVTSAGSLGADLYCSKKQPLAIGDVVSLRVKHNRGSDIWVNTSTFTIREAFSQ